MGCRNGGENEWEVWSCVKLRGRDERGTARTVCFRNLDARHALQVDSQQCALKVDEQ